MKGCIECLKLGRHCDECIKQTDTVWCGKCKNGVLTRPTTREEVISGKYPGIAVSSSCNCGAAQAQQMRVVNKFRARTMRAALWGIRNYPGDEDE